MSNFSRFMKANKKTKPNVKYAATASLCDENGKPLDWEIRRLSSKEVDEIRDECSYETQVVGKPGVYRIKLKSSLYMARIVAASVVFPDLYDKELQDSYGVAQPWDLVQAMVDDPGEYADFIGFVQTFQGFDKDMKDKVEEAKN